MCSRLRVSVLRTQGQVPARVTESFILSGYRLEFSFTQCLISAFRPTNETGNFWTHFLGLFVFAFHFWELFDHGSRASLLEPFLYPYWSYCVGVGGLLVVSSMAHLFNSMSLLIREICFFIDYGTISVYTVSSSLCYYYYIHHGGQCQGAPATPSQLDSWFEMLYIPCTCLIALLCTMFCCNTRIIWRRHRYTIRTLVFLLPFTISSSPVFYKLYTGTQRSGDTLAFFTRHCFWLLASAIFNISKIPERFCPGKFDIVGHSHQWFHFCTFMSILDELHMIKGEMKIFRTELGPSPTFLHTFGVLLCLQCCTAALITWFSVQAVSTHRISKSQ
ncbi:membrane progestin receptor epsilon [Carcharodon carcharias]|uniref:membrane progestin receptor epsilon n=1 Tax=Carcharodon carcharias TaxID=13397 RepID=UPI001B7F304B|nr:membrane progestin receptor epsilon [Carcharodon carcharias]